MNEDNKKFVSDMMTKIGAVELLHTKNTKLTETKQDLKYKMNQMIKFINNDVVGASTSSLIRTNIQIGEDVVDYNNKKYHDVLTINHHGFGTIKNADASYGSTMSREMGDNDFSKYILDKDIQVKLLAFLKENGNNKMLSVCTYLFSKIYILDGVKEISDKYYGEETREVLDSEIEVAVPSMFNYKNNSTNPTVELVPIKHIVTKSSSRIYFYGANATEEDLDTADRYSFGRNKDSTTPCAAVNYSEIEGTMVMIQIIDEMNQFYDKVNAKLATDVAKCKEVQEQLELEFATYKFASELKGGKK